MAPGQDLVNSRKPNPAQGFKTEAKKFLNAVASVVNELTNPAADLKNRNPNEKTTFAGELKEALVSMATRSTLNVLVLPPSNINNGLSKPETLVLSLNANAKARSKDVAMLPPRINRTFNNGKVA